MKSYGLNFISDENLYNHVKETVDKYVSEIEIDLNRFNSNIIDPIKLSFDSGVYKKDIDQVIESEITRQIDKSNNNHIGYFHQNIFQYFGDGWEIPSSGFDIINKKRSFFVEIKNKHNTMNSSSSQKLYMKMQSKILEDDSATCMLVEVISKKSQDIKWVISLDGKQHSHKNIRRISIDKFYEIVTGEKDSFAKLCSVLPNVISDIVENIKIEDIGNKVILDLRKKSPNLLNSLYLMAFEEYEGFDGFSIR